MSGHPPDAAHQRPRAPRRCVSWASRRRTALTCACLVLLIALASLLLAGLAWRALLEQRLAGGGSGAVSGALSTSSAREGPPQAAGSLEAPDRTKTSVAPGAPPTSAVAGSSPDDVLLSGPVLSAASASIILALGATAAWRVLRRYRRAEEADHATDSALLPFVQPDGQEPGDPSAGTEHGAVPSQDEDTAPAVEDGAVPHEEPGDGGGEESIPVQQLPTGLPELLALRVSVGGPLPAVSEGVVLQALRHQPDARVDGGWTSLMAETPAGATDAEREQRRVSAEREVLYDRRAAPRITFVAAALLEWKERCYPVTVLDLSESGLRCELTARDTTSPKPGNAEYVRISFILPSGRVNLKAQIAWNRRVPEGTQLGLQFLKLSDEATALLRVVCLAGVPM